MRPHHKAAMYLKRLLGCGVRSMGCIVMQGMWYYVQPPLASLSLAASVASEAAARKLRGASLLNLLHARYAAVAGASDIQHRTSPPCAPDMFRTCLPDEWVCCLYCPDRCCLAANPCIILIPECCMQSLKMHALASMAFINPFQPGYLAAGWDGSGVASYRQITGNVGFSSCGCLVLLQVTRLQEACWASYCKRALHHTSRCWSAGCVRAC